jgi:hypothetical protein
MTLLPEDSVKTATERPAAQTEINGMTPHFDAGIRSKPASDSVHTVLSARDRRVADAASAHM